MERAQDQSLPARAAPQSETISLEVRADGSVVVRVHVQPGATRTAVVGTHGDALKVAVSAPADRGRANDAVVALLAKVFGVPRRDVEVVGGATSRAKRVAIRGVDVDSVRHALEESRRGPASGAPASIRQSSGKPPPEGPRRRARP